MRKLNFFFIVILMSLYLAGFAQNVHHEITANLDIAGNSISVTDLIRVPVAMSANPDTINFYLNKNLTLDKSQQQVKIDGPLKTDPGALYSKYRIDFPALF